MIRSAVGCSSEPLPRVASRTFGRRVAQACAPPWRSAAVACLVGLAWLVQTPARTAAQARPADATCPDPAPLRQLVGLDGNRALQRRVASLLGVRQPRPNRQQARDGCRAFVIAGVHRTWATRAGECDQVIVVVRTGLDCGERDTRQEASIYGAIGVDERGRLTPRSRMLSERDPRVLGDPKLPDLDGDGWSEWVRIGDAGDDVSGALDDSSDIDECTTCCLWATPTVQLMSSRDTPLMNPTPLGPVDLDLRRRLQAALRSGPRDESDVPTSCPSPTLQWSHRRSPMTFAVSREGSVVVLEVAHWVETCTGWEFPPGGSSRACGGERREVLRVPVPRATTASRARTAP